MFVFGEKNARGRRWLLQACVERDGVFNGWKIGAAGLFGCFVSETPPSLDALLCRLREMLLCATSDDRNDLRYAEFGGFFNGPLHAVKFEHGDEQRDGQSRFSSDLFE